MCCLKCVRRSFRSPFRGNRHAWSLAGSHYFRFEFIRVPPPFAATRRSILVNSVHLSTYSLSGHDAPKAAASIQDAITGCLRPFGLQILQFRRHTLVNGLAQRTHGAARLPLLCRAAARPQPRTRHVALAKHGSHHDRPGVLVRQHRATTIASQLALHPPGGLLRHQ